MLYIEERKKLSQTNDVIVAVDQLIDKYNMLKIQNSRLDKTTLRNTLGMFRRYHLVQNIDSDMSNPDTRIIIYPSILFAVSNASLEEMYQAAKDKLEKYSKGGDADERSDSADNEEAD